ncbi:UNVERIFIED_CONTAM: hypothetical protein ABID98_003577 [Brevibacillus sp. OAP136]
MKVVRLTRKALIGAAAAALLFISGMMSGETVFAKATQAFKGDLSAMLGIGQPPARNDSPTQAPNEHAEGFDNSVQAAKADPTVMEDHANYALNALYYVPIGQDVVMQVLTHQTIPIPKKTNGSLTPVSRIVHGNLFFMAESVAVDGRSKASINCYQLDRANNKISLLFSQPILDIAEGTAYSFTYNEATQQLTVNQYKDAKLSAVTNYELVDNAFLKKEELVK